MGLFALLFVSQFIIVFTLNGDLGNAENSNFSSTTTLVILTSIFAMYTAVVFLLVGLMQMFLC